jgi:DNA-binding NarL/FixJ family response regulator
VAATVHTAPRLVAQLIGPPGLAFEVFRHVLEAAAIDIVTQDDSGEIVIADNADIIVLVEPGSDHWAAVQGRAIPIVLVQGNETDDADVVGSVLAGADAVLHCGSDPETVMAVMEEVGRGGSVMRPAQMRAVAGVARAASAHSGVVLSRRETEILASIADGKAVKQTARDLGISPKTVENLQGRLFRKLGARNRAQAVARAHALGLL